MCIGCRSAQFSAGGTRTNLLFTMSDERAGPRTECKGREFGFSHGRSRSPVLNTTHYVVEPAHSPPARHRARRIKDRTGWRTPFSMGFYEAHREWWSQTGSNRRPPACKAGALPTELWPQLSSPRRLSPTAGGLVGPGRVELPTSRLSGVRSNHLSYGPPVRRTPRGFAHGGPGNQERFKTRPRRKRNEDGGAPPSAGFECRLMFLVRSDGLIRSRSSGAEKDHP